MVHNSEACTNTMISCESQEAKSRAFSSMRSHQTEEEWQESTAAGHVIHPQHQPDTILNNSLYHHHEQQQQHQHQSSHYDVYTTSYGHQQDTPWQEEIQQSRSGPIAIRGEVDSDDDDSHHDDVERDAMRLREKYGAATMASSYQESLMESNKILKAPYLGSLSSSGNFLMSLPPMTLSDTYEDEEPPRNLTSYGSLRDSHERGRFLDGPSSYREPMSGQIRRLDHRLRYHSAQPPTNSIAERMQASRKLKEIRQQQQEKEGNGSKDNNNNHGSNKSSSLSAMMNEASKHNNESSQNTPLTSGLAQQFESSTESKTPSFGGLQQNYESSTMMSTSLTAFEVLKTTKVSSYGRSQSSLMSSSALNSDQFQPLARSMSDPTPHHQYSTSFRGGGGGGGRSAVGDGPNDYNTNNLPSILHSNNQHTQQQQPQPLPIPASGLSSLLGGVSSEIMDYGENPDMDVAFDMDV